MELRHVGFIRKTQLYEHALSALIYAFFVELL
jgi:hypothetical protein